MIIVTSWCTPGVCKLPQMLMQQILLLASPESESYQTANHISDLTGSSPPTPASVGNHFVYTSLRFHGVSPTHTMSTVALADGAAHITEDNCLCIFPLVRSPLTPTADRFQVPVAEPLIEIKCQRELLKGDQWSQSRVYVEDKYVSSAECLRLLVGKCTVI